MAFRIWRNCRRSMLFIVAALNGSACAHSAPAWRTNDFDAVSSATYEFKCRAFKSNLTFSDDGGSRPLLKEASFNGKLLKTAADMSKFSERVKYVTHFSGSCMDDGIDIVISGKANVKYKYLDQFAARLSVSESGIKLYQTVCFAHNSSEDLEAARKDPACQSVTYNIEEHP